MGTLNGGEAASMRLLSTYVFPTDPSFPFVPCGRGPFILLLTLCAQGILMLEAHTEHSAGYFISVTNSPLRYSPILKYVCRAP